MDKSQFSYTLYKIVFNIQNLGLTRHTLFPISSIGRACGFVIVPKKLVRKFAASDLGCVLTFIVENTLSLYLTVILLNEQKKNQ